MNTIKKFITFDNFFKISLLLILLKIALYGIDVSIDYDSLGGFPVDIDGASISVDGEIHLR